MTGNSHSFASPEYIAGPPFFGLVAFVGSGESGAAAPLRLRAPQWRLFAWSGRVAARCRPGVHSTVWTLPEHGRDSVSDVPLAE